MATRSYLFGGLLGCLALTTTAWAGPSALLDVRVGPHKRFDRVVFEFGGETESRVVQKGAQKVEVRFSDAEVPADFALPMLPPGLSVVRELSAFREGSDVVFVISLSREAAPSELSLAGQPWRLAVDLAPRVSETPVPHKGEDKKPEYIPGDLPISTKLADRGPALPDSLDPARVHAVLAYYYLSRGDTQQARQEAELYQAMTGKVLDPSLQPPANPQPQAPPSPKTPRWPLPMMDFWSSIAAVFAAGIAGGAVIRGIIARSRAARRGRVQGRPEGAPEASPEQLEADLNALDEAVSQEPPRAQKAEPMAPPASEPIPEPVMAEDEMRESLMDRRVRRVVELSRDGRSIAAIAEELQMGQDEVKLILDLNQ